MFWFKDVLLLWKAVGSAARPKYLNQPTAEAVSTPTPAPRLSATAADIHLIRREIGRRFFAVTPVICFNLSIAGTLRTLVDSGSVVKR